MNLFDLFVKIGVKDEASDKVGKISEKLGNGLKTAAKVGTVAITAASGAIVAFTKSAIENYAEYEQLVGGVETLFGAGGKSLEEYAASVGKSAEEAKGEWYNLLFSQQKVLDNAANAFKTAGMSANEYMSTVTSFSASLLQSVGGDTVAAADYANLALTDMSDNANKMGSSIETIQSAYMGFAKQNYTMLDNLKLGYGGTATEMARLINDSGVLGDQMIDLGDKQNIGAALAEVGFAKMVEAIHVVQTEMGITGTTALEASTTIQGSLGMTKAAWTNLLTGLADDSADFDKLINDLVEAIAGDESGKGGFLGNIIPRVQKVLEGSVELINRLAPKIIDALPVLVKDVVPSVVTAAINIVDALVKALPSVVTALEEAVPEAVDGVFKLLGSLVGSMPEILKSAVKIIVALAKGIAKNTKELTKTIVDVVLLLCEVITEPETLSDFIDAAIEIMIALAEGLIESIPSLLEKAPVIIQNLVTAIVENAPKLWKASWEIIGMLVKGIIDKLPEIGETAGDIIDILGQGISDYWEAIKKVGTEIIKGLWEGISNSWGWLKEKLGGFFSGIIGKAKDDFDIHSPSRVFATIGENISLGLAEGIENKEQAVFDAIEGLAKDASDAFIEEFDKYFNAFDLFEKPDLEPVSGKELLSNLEDQVTAMYRFSEGVKELSARTTGNLAAEIEAKGVQALPELMALLELSDKELHDYEFAYNQKQRLATTYAFTETRGLTTMEELTLTIKNLVERMVSNPFIDPESGEVKLYLDTGALAGGLINELDVLLGENFSTNLRGALA